MSENISKRGGIPVELPFIEIENLKIDLNNLSKYKAILFNSPNGVKAFFENIKDMRSLANIQIGAVGVKTKEALEKNKIVPDFVPEEYLVDRLQHDAGCFKSSQNAIVGAEFQTASPSETPYLVRQWIDNTNYRLNNAKEDTEILEILADTHIQFERIHPFSDGNGRCGRLVLLYLGIKYLNSPLIISKENRAEYMEYLAEQNISGLTTLLSSSLKFEKERITQFN